MEYSNSGKLSPNKYKTAADKKPDMTGELIMQRSVLKNLLEEHDGDEINIKLGAWQMSSQFGPWLRLSWNSYKKPEGQTPYTPRPVAQPAPRPPVADEDSPF
jgi:hypothetical protein